MAVLYRNPHYNEGCYNDVELYVRIFQYFEPSQSSGASCSKLATLLVNVTLKFQM